GPARANRGERGPGPRQGRRDGLPRVPADGDVALLAALAQDPDVPVVQVHVVDVEPGELRDPKARAVEQFEDGTVPHPRGRRGIGCLHEGPDVVDRQRVWQRAGPLWAPGP